MALYSLLFDSLVEAEGGQDIWESVMDVQIKPEHLHLRLLPFIQPNFETTKRV